MEVSAGATNVQFVMSGGTGDADLYVKFGSAPTDSSFDCRPSKSGNAETCTGSSSGGTCDDDLYVRNGAQSTTSSYDCRPYKNGNTETCTFTSPVAGTWYIDIYG